MVLYGLVLWWAACFVPSHAFANTAQFLVHLAYLQESPEVSHPDQLASAKFSPFEGELVQNFPSSATWIRVTIQFLQAPLSHEARVVRNDLYTLKVGPNILPRVDLFESSQDGWTQRTDHGFQSRRQYRCLDERHCFSLDQMSEPTKTLYLRVESAGNRRVQVEIEGTQELFVSTVDRIRTINASLTIGVCLLFVSMYLLAVDRSSLMLSFVLFQCSNILGLVSVNGLLAQWLPLGLTDLTFAAYGSLIMRTLMILLLCMTLLHPHKMSRTYTILSIVLFAMSLINLMLVLAGNAQVALPINFLVWIALPLVQVFGAVSTQDLHPTIRRLFIFGNVLLLGLITSAIKGLYFPTEIDAYLPGVRSLSDHRLNGIWVSLILFAVVVLERQHQAQVRKASLAALQRRAEDSRNAELRLAERSSLIDMLTHELKNPLGTIRFAVGSLGHMLAANPDGEQRVKSIQSCVARMDALIVHVAQANKIEQLTPRRQTQSIVAEPLALRLIEDLGLEDRVLFQIQGLATLAADPELVGVILENLLKNADTYGNASEPIELSISSQPDGWTCIEVSNSVHSDAMPDPDMVFTRYYRHSTAQAYPGMGIGLSLIRSTATKLGGSVEYRPRTNRVSFIVRIPS
jgi:signal transduction histidine kinase